MRHNGGGSLMRVGADRRPHNTAGDSAQRRSTRGGDGLVEGTQPARPRTILPIVADDLGWGDASCYSPDSRVLTPALDRLAREGLRLTHARTPSALCTPSRYALLTGRPHRRAGAARPLVDPYGPPLLEPGATTLATVLGGAGYRTALVGKWHLGLRYGRANGALPAASEERDPSMHGRWTQREDEVDFGRPVSGGPTELGFDRFFGTAGCCTSDPPYAFLDGERFTEAPTLQAPPEMTALPGVMPGAMVPGWDVRTIDDILVDQTTGLLAEHAAEPDGPPLFLWLALSAPHNPWEPPEALAGATGDGARGDMAAFFDRSVGRVLDALDELGLADDALVLVTSDHGPQYEQGQHGHRPTGPLRGRKNTVWEGGLRVPFWLRWPGRIPAGSISDAAGVHLDVLPTLASLAGAALPTDFASEGLDRSSAWLGTASGPRPPLLFECGGARHRIGGWAVIDGAYKLIVELDEDGREAAKRLYDLDADPGERSDRASERPAVVSRLERHLHGELRDAGWATLADPPASGSAEP